MMKLSVVIVNYNVRYFLEQALLSVQEAAKKVPTEVFVVDNNSVDDSVVMVKAQFPTVHLIANKDNPGFSKANNQAIRLAKGDYVLLLNPDTVVEEDTFEKCIAFMDAHPLAGGLGVKMIDGSGNFLPESKRGLPTPYVAFFKAFGLSKIFPKSKTFNRYHLGYLDKDQTHEVDVLAGAFMLLRKSVLDKIGLLDETFFMYGEDIDLSYRITQAGYKNYYFSESTIIHYKGESTKRGSLNYVRTFYNAMIIFSQKHLQGEQAKVMVWLLQLAIYFRAFLTLLSNFLKKIYLPVLDVFVIFGGLYWLKDFWAAAWFDTPDYYQPSFIYFNIPLYISIWLLTVFFKGGYDPPYSIERLFSGLAIGSILLAAIYGLLPLEYRTSRMLLLLGAVWAFIATFFIRVLFHFLKNKNFQVGKSQPRNLILIGDKQESERVIQLLQQVGLVQNFIGIVRPTNTVDPYFLSGLPQLEEVVQVYQIEEIIFCSKDIPAQEIMSWMTQLGPRINYKIVPAESMNIIGSHSKNTPGELYTQAVQYRIDTPLQRRNKRLLDLIVTLILVISSPLTIWGIQQKGAFIKNLGRVLIGQKTWIGYIKNGATSKLPTLKKGIISPLVMIPHTSSPASHTLNHLNFLYARDYDWRKDMNFLWAGYKYLGNA